MVTLMSRWPATSWANVGRHAVHDRVGDQDSAEVVWGESQGFAADVGDPAAGQGVADQLTHGGSGDRAVLAAEVSLEQQRHRRVPDPFVVVVGRDQRDGAELVAYPADD